MGVPRDLIGGDRETSFKPVGLHSAITPNERPGVSRHALAKEETVRLSSDV